MPSSFKCRICKGSSYVDMFTNFCGCIDESRAYVHKKCFETDYTANKTMLCQFCKTPFRIRGKGDIVPRTWFLIWKLHFPQAFQSLAVKIGSYMLFDSIIQKIAYFMNDSENEQVAVILAQLIIIFGALIAVDVAVSWVLPFVLNFPRSWYWLRTSMKAFVGELFDAFDEFVAHNAYWKEFEAFKMPPVVKAVPPPVDALASPPSPLEPICRICLGTDVDDMYTNLCYCKGSSGFLHGACFAANYRVRNNYFCELCYKRYPLKSKLGRRWRPIRQWQLPGEVAEVVHVVTFVIIALACLIGFGIGAALTNHYLRFNYIFYLYYLEEMVSWLITIYSCLVALFIGIFLLFALFCTFQVVIFCLSFVFIPLIEFVFDIEYKVPDHDENIATIKQYLEEFYYTNTYFDDLDGFMVPPAIYLGREEILN